jgi:hypothetical protein
MPVTFRQIAPALGLLLAFALISRCQSDSWSRERDELVSENVALRATSRADSVRAAEKSARADSLDAVAARAENRSQQAEARADRLRAERRRLLAAAGRVDTGRTSPEPVTPVDSALTLAIEETVVLRAALEWDRNALVASQQQVAELRGALSLETASGAALRVQLASATTLLRRADPPCRILLWGCPSRTVVAVGGALLGAGFTYAIVR